MHSHILSSYIHVFIQFGEVLSDENNKPIKAQHDIILPKGWEWFDDNDWDVDSDRAVDNDGWYIYLICLVYSDIQV